MPHDYQSHVIFKRIGNDKTKITIIRSPSGTYTAQGGGGYGNGATEDDAIKNAIAMIRQTNAEAAERSKAADAKDAKKTTCSVCGARVVNMKTHEQSREHRNMAQWNEYERNRNTRV